MKKVLCILLCFLLSLANVAQSKYYFSCCEKGDSLFHVGKYLQSAQTYDAAFASFGGKGHLNDRYNAARSWAMANQPDTALSHLEKIVYKGRYAAHNRLSTDSDFNSLHTNIRWQNLIDTAKAISAHNKIKSSAMEKLYEPELAARLDSIRKLDQYYRKQLEETEKRSGRYSKEVNILWEKIRYQDSVNLLNVKQVLDTRGWLGPEIVLGGSNALFLVIQHSDLNTQLKYLPMMREAVKSKKLDPGSLAMLEDRVLLGQNKKQIYGTQIRRDSITGKPYVAPLIDPDNVDKRRAEVGLGSLSDYVSHWDLVWNSEVFKEEMAERERKTKIDMFLKSPMPK